MDNSIIKSFKVELAKLNFIHYKIFVMVKKIDMLVVMDSYIDHKYNFNFKIIATLYFARNYLDIMVMILE